MDCPAGIITGSGTSIGIDPSAGIDSPIGISSSLGGGTCSGSVSSGSVTTSPDSIGVDSSPSAFLGPLVINGRKTVRVSTKTIRNNASKTLKTINGFLLADFIGGFIGGVWGG